MGSLSYISQKSMMLLRFKAARTRLMATSGSLSDTRIASATEEINQLSDDIRAKGATSSNAGVRQLHQANRPTPGSWHCCDNWRNKPRFGGVFLSGDRVD
jgi:hypothetical protein